MNSPRPDVLKDIYAASTPIVLFSYLRGRLYLL